MTRDRLAYYLDPAKELIDSTPAGALLRRFGDNAANALGLRQPFERLGERFVPDFGDSFDFGKMLPDFAGLKLTDLMPDVLVPGRVPDWVRIRHGFDEKALLGWRQQISTCVWTAGRNSSR